MRVHTRFHMRGRLLFAVVLCVAMRLAAQSPPTTVYTESFRQGATHVLEDGF